MYYSTELCLQNEIRSWDVSQKCLLSLQLAAGIGKSSAKRSLKRCFVVVVVVVVFEGKAYYSLIINPKTLAKNKVL